MEVNQIPEEKVRFALRMSSNTQRLVKEHYPRDNCASQNEFIEKAINFYIGYLSAGDVSGYLSDVVLTSIKGTIKGSEDRIARLLFKLSVEQCILMNIVAAYDGIQPEQISRLRGKCVDDVKRTNGAVQFEDAVKFQKGQ